MRRCSEEVERVFLSLEKTLRRWEFDAKQAQSIDVAELAAGSLLSGSLLALAWVLDDPNFAAGLGLDQQRRGCPAEGLETVLRAVLAHSTTLE